MRVVVWLGLVVVPFSGVWAQDCNETDSASRAVFFRYGLDDGQQGRAERISNCKPYQDGYANGRGIRSLAAPRAVAAPTVQPNVSKPPVNGVSVTVPHVNRPLFGGGGRNDVEAFTRDGRAFVIGADGRAREVRAGEGDGSRAQYNHAAGHGHSEAKPLPNVNAQGYARSNSSGFTFYNPERSTQESGVNPRVNDSTGGSVYSSKQSSPNVNSQGYARSNSSGFTSYSSERTTQSRPTQADRTGGNPGGSGGSQKSNSGSGGRSIGNGGGV